MKKELVLCLFSILFLGVFFLLPKNRVWFNERIVGYWNDFRHQKNTLDDEQRKTKRWGNGYTFSKQIAGFFSDRQKASKALLLIPPTGYFTARGIDYHVPEPAVFYYYTGLKTTWVNSEVAKQANWMVTAENGVIRVVPVVNQKALLDSLQKFSIYPVVL